MDRIDFLWWLKFSPAFEVNRIQCGWIRCVREMSLQFHWAEANAVQRNWFSMHRKYFRITKTDSKCIQPESLILCLYSEISNRKYDGRFTMTNFIVIYTKPNESVVLCWSKTPFSHILNTIWAATAMECLFCTALLCQPLSVFAFVLVDKAAGIATDN